MWISFLSLAITYNAMSIPLRASFGEEVTGGSVLYVWLTLDIIADLYYLTDAIAVQPRLCNEGCYGADLKVRSSE